MRGPRSTSPCPTKQQIEKLKILQTAIKKRTTKPDFITTYRIHIILSILIGFIIIPNLSFTKQTKEYIIINESEINSHNQQGHSYTLGSNTYFYNITLMQAKTLFKNDFTQQINVERCKQVYMDEIPLYYNFKEAHPQCNHQVYNQGNCSSSYSIAVSSSFSDRLCKQNQTQQLSAQNLLSCDGKLNFGCQGGDLTRSADYILTHGLTTNECHPFKGDDTFKNCTQAFYHCQRYKAESYCQLKNKEDIKKDILIKGPVVAIISIYKDFLIYKDGIYQVFEEQTQFDGRQAVKILGWGEQNKQQYWIIENTWGDTWGMKGLALIAMDSFSDMAQQALSINN